MTTFYYLYALAHNCTWWTLELQVRWQVMGEPVKNQFEWIEPLKNILNGRPPERGGELIYLDSRCRPKRERSFFPKIDGEQCYLLFHWIMMQSFEIKSQYLKLYVI